MRNYNPKSIQYIGVTVFFLQTKGAKVFGAEKGPKKWLSNLGLLMLAPMVPLIILLGFFYSWKIGNAKREVYIVLKSGSETAGNSVEFLHLV